MQACSLRCGDMRSNDEDLCQHVYFCLTTAHAERSRCGPVAELRLNEPLQKRKKSSPVTQRAALTSFLPSHRTDLGAVHPTKCMHGPSTAKVSDGNMQGPRAREPPPRPPARLLIPPIGLFTRPILPAISSAPAHKANVRPYVGSHRTTKTCLELIRLRFLW